MGQVIETVDGTLKKQVEDILKRGRITSSEYNFAEALIAYHVGHPEQKQHAKDRLNNEIGSLDHPQNMLTVSDLHPAIWAFCGSALSNKLLE